VQAEQADVVAGVTDDGDLGVRGGGFQPPEETGGADPSGEHGDAHDGQSGKTRAIGARRPASMAVIPAFWPGLPGIAPKLTWSLSRIPLDGTQDTRV